MTTNKESQKTIPSILQKIKEKKQEEIAILKNSSEFKKYKNNCELSNRDFKRAISKQNKGLNLIAEFKRRSPSKGEIRMNADVGDIVKLYEKCGASAVSVLTDSHFGGKIEDLNQARENTSLPILCKDFIIDDAQIYRARYFGADAILLIAALLDSSQMQKFIDVAKSLGMDCLVESHNKEELEKVIETDAEIFGINNRDLNNFNVDRQTTLRLSSYIPDGKIITAESGILNRNHLQEFINSDRKINAMLIGEGLMSEELHPTMRDIEGTICELLG